MKWAKERDLLIAQTKAFVQSLGKKPEIDAPAETRLEVTPVEVAPVEVAPAMHVENPEPPVDIAPIARPARPSPRSDVRDEIQGRVAAFRAHQQLFHRERDAYFNSVLARVRQSAVQPPKTPGG